MQSFQPNFKPKRSAGHAEIVDSDAVTVEIFVGPDFDSLETSSITRTLREANELLQKKAFDWRFISDQPGLVDARGGMIVRAEPAIDEHGFSDIMFVVGGDSGASAVWLKRARQAQRQSRKVVLFSDAATAYIQNTQNPKGNVTTHWRDAATLREAGYHPKITDHLAEVSDGLVTAAGAGSTIEIVLGIISAYLDPLAVAELANILLLETIRKSNADQPKDLAASTSLWNSRVTKVIRVMEDNITDPLDMQSLTREVGMSSRQVERIFREFFDQSPAKFYKQLRTKKAWALVEATPLPLAEVAVATGFGSVSTLSRAVRDQYGVSPAQVRARKDVSLMKIG
ncbi:GlxA family transcriptional regulator [Aliiroseovarius sp. 2305UL8-7]|uniref:GlxA family transcriptional regulator n=1 Tax=Aliiroseovarius conchicola TaxID=3121637 RepID=UPI003528AAEC